MNPALKFIKALLCYIRDSVTSFSEVSMFALVSLVTVGFFTVHNFIILLQRLSNMYNSILVLIFHFYLGVWYDVEWIAEIKKTQYSKKSP